MMRHFFEVRIAVRPQPCLEEYITGPIPGWWLGHPSEKYEFVNWDDDIPNTWENKIDVPNHQPDNRTIGMCVNIPTISPLSPLSHPFDFSNFPPINNPASGYPLFKIVPY